MTYIVVDCGGFKRIIPTDQGKVIKELQENFSATIEGDETGKPKLLTGSDVASILNGKGTKKTNIDEIINNNVKKVNRK